MANEEKKIACGQLTVHFFKSPYFTIVKMKRTQIKVNLDNDFVKNKNFKPKCAYATHCQWQK